MREAGKAMDDQHALFIINDVNEIRASMPAGKAAIARAADALQERIDRAQADAGTEGPDGNVRLTESDLVADLRIALSAERELRAKADALAGRAADQRKRAQVAEDLAYDMRVEMLNIAELCCEMQGTMQDADVAPTVKLRECERTLLAIRKIADEYTGS